MKPEQAYEELMKYREGLIECGKRLTKENPDRLSIQEFEALVEKIFAELNKIDMSLGYPYMMWEEGVDIVYLLIEFTNYIWIFWIGMI